MDKKNYSKEEFLGGLNKANNEKGDFYKNFERKQ